jgi:hypothetical protein
VFGTLSAIRAVRIASSIAMFIEALFVSRGSKRQACIEIQLVTMKIDVDLKLLCNLSALSI